MSDPQNTRGVPGEAEEADNASGGPAERMDGTPPEPEAAEGTAEDDDEETADRDQ
ncbi:hypothetical protein [Microbacterium sp. CIAB417]|uniref:hypothetical protein n=1 Tax=Microbacterium sp. CIAB417 TaxID=2860287 RepID=UPI001FAE32B0|nr:hypothetical protein [Microbacterium sp. CIAB417]